MGNPLELLALLEGDEGQAPRYVGSLDALHSFLADAMGLPIDDDQEFTQVVFAGAAVTVSWQTVDRDGLYTSHSKSFPVVWS